MTTETDAHLRLSFSLARDRFTIEVDEALSLRRPIALFGPTGSGKTSILRAIAGLDRADAGSIGFGEELWQDGHRFVPPWRRRVGLVFQDSRLFGHLNVSGNLELALNSAGGPTRFSSDDVVNRLDIGTLLKRDTASLSGGETQRVAIARSLLAQPRLLLMDEPLSSLDRSARRETIEYIADVTSAFDLPLIYVTHDAGEVARLAGATLLLDRGKVADFGPTPDVFARMHGANAGPSSVSIIAATAADETDGLQTISVGSQPLRVPSTGRNPGEELQLRIAARDVVLATERIENTSIRNVLEGSIESVEHHGAGTANVRIDIDGQVLKAFVTHSAVSDLGLTDGSRVYAMIKSVALSDSGMEANE